jgi:hypothetical protein
VWVLNYADLSNTIGVPKFHHVGRLIATGTIGKKAITPYPNLFCRVHFHVLQHMSIVSEYLDKHNEILLRDNPEHNELRLANEHRGKFNSWLWDRISQSDTHISKHLKKLARGPIFTVVTYHGYDINEYTFYTKQQDKKNVRIVVYMLMLIMLRAKTKPCTMVK